MYKSYIKSHSPIFLNKYLKYKNKLVTIIREAGKSYYANKLAEVKDNLSKTLKVMNEMCGRNSLQKQITKIRVNDETIDDPKQIANKFNELAAVSNVPDNTGYEILPVTKYRIIPDIVLYRISDPTGYLIR